MLIIFTLLIITKVTGLKNVQVGVPAVVKLNETVVMNCTYDLEKEEILYSVKWYKSGKEFYRYLPKEMPAAKVFPLQDINVDINKSGKNRVVIRNVHRNHSGKYKCEVSTDLPYVHIQFVTAQMHVVEPPLGEPSLRLDKSQYAVNETVRANCSSPSSSPPSNISWFLNDKKIEAKHENLTAIKEGDTTKDEPLIKYVKTSYVEFRFKEGKLKIECKTDVFAVFAANVTLIVDEERPKLAPIKGIETADDAAIRQHSTTLTSYLLILMLVLR